MVKKWHSLCSLFFTLVYILLCLQGLDCKGSSLSLANREKCRLRPHPKKGMLEYDTKLHLMVRL